MVIVDVGGDGRPVAPLLELTMHAVGLTELGLLFGCTASGHDMPRTTWPGMCPGHCSIWYDDLGRGLSRRQLVRVIVTVSVTVFMDAVVLKVAPVLVFDVRVQTAPELSVTARRCGCR